jgi:hypothetical protein
VDIQVALMTDDERLATPRRHHRHPQRLVRSPVPLQALERTNVMHLDAIPAAAQFARICEESLHDLRGVREPKWMVPIVKRGADTPCERNPTPLRNQRGLALTRNLDCESGSSLPIFSKNLDAIAPVHLRDADAEFPEWPKTVIGTLSSVSLAWPSRLR